MPAFYRVRDHEHQALVVAYLDDEWRFWEWAPPTGEFHLADWLTDDYFSATPSLSYEEVDLQRAREWIEKQVGKSQPRFASRFRRDIDAGRYLASADLLGGDVVPSETPRERATRKAQEARRQPGWVEYRTYDEPERANAYAAAHQIRAGRIKALPPAAFDAKSHRTDDGGYVVFIRHKRGDGEAAGPVLTDDESEILHLIADGMADREIAVRLQESPERIHSRISSVVRKLDARTRGDEPSPASTSEAATR